MENEVDPREHVLATWWTGLRPDQQSQLFSGRWDPLPGWASESAAAAGIPLLIIHSTDHPPRAYFPTEVENFLDHVALTGPMATN